VSVKILKVLFSYWTIAFICMVLSFALIPAFLGTNTGEDVCVYTVEELEETYIRDGSAYGLYDPQKHRGIDKTYIKNGEEYFPNNPNWSFMGKPCVLTQGGVRLIFFGYLISFVGLFTFLGIMRMALGEAVILLQRYCKHPGTQ
jgi:hypothetical protein